MDVSGWDAGRFVAWCHEVSLGLPGATVDQPFGPGAETFRVHGKVFALLTQADAVGPHPIVNVKAEPREVPLLIEAHPFVHPGWHMNKKHWVTVELCAATELGLAAELVEDSYDNVVAGLPLRLRSTLRTLGPAPRAPGHLPLR